MELRSFQIYFEIIILFSVNADKELFNHSCYGWKWLEFKFIFLNQNLFWKDY